MYNSLLILASTYSKNKKLNITFGLLWISFMLLGSNFSLGLFFPAVNIITFITIFLSLNKIKNEKVRKTLSILSILIWSTLIDIICYYAFPAFSGNISLIGYIYNGLLFNYRHVLTNITVVVVTEAILYLINKTKSKLKEKTATYQEN